MNQGILPPGWRGTIDGWKEACKVSSAWVIVVGSSSHQSFWDSMGKRSMCGTARYGQWAHVWWLIGQVWWPLASTSSVFYLALVRSIWIVVSKLESIVIAISYVISSQLQFCVQNTAIQSQTCVSNWGSFRDGTPAILSASYMNLAKFEIFLPPLEVLHFTPAAKFWMDSGSWNI